MLIWSYHWYNASVYLGRSAKITGACQRALIVAVCSRLCSEPSQVLGARSTLLEHHINFKPAIFTLDKAKESIYGLLFAQVTGLCQNTTKV